MTQYAKPVVKVNMKIYCKKYGCRHMSISIFDGVYVKILLPSLPGLGECCSMSEVCKGSMDFHQTSFLPANHFMLIVWSIKHTVVSFSHFNGGFGRQDHHVIGHCLQSFPIKFTLVSDGSGARHIGQFPSCCVYTCTLEF